MKRSALAYLGSRRSQSLTEFALVAPVLLLLIFGVVDFGRALYYYVTLDQAANDGARVAVRNSSPLPRDQDVQDAVKQHAAAVFLANPCANGPLIRGEQTGQPSQVPPANQGWIYITQVSPSPTLVTSPPPGYANAPGGETNPSPNPPPGCNYIKAMAGNVPLQVTIRYNFVPLTPLIQQAAANRIVIEAYAVYRTEY